MTEGIAFATSLDGVDAAALSGGFFEGWAAPPSAEEHLALLRGSAHVVVALDEGRVVGFVNAISDGVLAAYIPLLEVLPEYRRRGVGSALVRLLLDDIGDLYMVDVMCEEDVLPFYEALGFQSARGGIRRNYRWQSVRPST